MYLAAKLTIVDLTSAADGIRGVRVFTVDSLCAYILTCIGNSERARVEIYFGFTRQPHEATRAAGA